MRSLSNGRLGAHEWSVPVARLAPPARAVPSLVDGAKAVLPRETCLQLESDCIKLDTIWGIERWNVLAELVFLCGLRGATRDPDDSELA